MATTDAGLMWFTVGVLAGVILSYIVDAARRGKVVRGPWAGAGARRVSGDDSMPPVTHHGKCPACGDAYTYPSRCKPGRCLNQ